MAAGLCDTCQWQRSVSGKASRFSLCRRSVAESGYAKYPPLPVRRCAGFEARSSRYPGREEAEEPAMRLA